ncbi:SIR2 family protein [Mangrovitalea sediminis]|uniref:SIR2 family protein n=1 Tax=Mangrovitalea sediminis TaxID=1982043 RepID=UPI000BE4EA89|nr:SIR2 family protein [Mangrovitalea sediminis]
MELSDLKKILQDHFTDGLAIVVGSGLSAAEGIPGMWDLAQHLLSVVPASLPVGSESAWSAIEADLKAGIDLESALLKTAPPDALEAIIVTETAGLIESYEAKILEEVLAGTRELRFSSLLKHIVKPSSGVPVVTTNYDRLVEVAVEFCGMGVDVLFSGQNIGNFDPKESKASLCRGVKKTKSFVYLTFKQHITVLKPHGSLDWFLRNGEPIRCTLGQLGRKLLITPGVNKFRGGYDRPFDAHRERANREIDKASRYLILGYGFNDDHLQVHLDHQLRSGKPAVLLTRSLSSNAKRIAAESPGMTTIFRINDDQFGILNSGNELAFNGPPIWDLGIFVKEVLEP